jgi:MYXO-CTERM domain-containing protein
MVMGTLRARARWIVALAMAGGVSFTEPAAEAHHSFAMFDFSKTLTLHATVQEFQWTNPHVILSFAVAADGSDGGAPSSWWAELTSPGNLTRVGWSKRAFKAGDRIDIDIHPLRDGTHGGAFAKAVLVDTGQTWTSDLRSQERPGLGLSLDAGDEVGAGAAAPKAKGGCSSSGDGPASPISSLALALAAGAMLLARRRTSGR